MKRRGRPVLGAISGLFLGIFLALDLWLFGIVALDSIVLTIVIVLGLVLGIAVGLTAPRGRADAAARTRRAADAAT